MFKSPSSTRWNFKSRTVNAVYENKEALLNCMKKLETSSQSTTTVQEARGLRFNLMDEDFLFWLEFFHRVMPHLEILYMQIQSRQIDSIKAKKAVDAFRMAVHNIRDSIDSMPIELDRDCSGREKRRRFENHRVSDAKEVCDRITVEVSSRFQSSSHLDVAKLLDCDNFLEYSQVFPENVLQMAVEQYPMLKKDKLRTELKVLYERQDFRNIDGAVPLLQLFIKNNLACAFGEVTTLLRIIVTIPMTTSEPERCFSSLKRVKTFLRNSMKQDRLCALAMLSIEKRLVTSTKDFNMMVIDKFAGKKNRRMEFNFRH